MAQVRIEHVFKRFGPVTAVNDFNLTVEDGEFVSILGPSGCGKTTSLRMIAGFEKATEGEIYIGDHCVSSSSQNKFVPPENRDIGMVFQSYAVWPHMTVVENVAYPLKIQKVPKEERLKRVNEMLELVHLGEYGHRYPHQLSGGMRQRVVIAIALSCNPDLLICDEPTTALDVTIQAKIIELIRRVQKERGISVIYITHDLGVVAKVADYVNVMYAGKIVEKGTINEIFYDPKHPYTWGLLSAMPDLDTDDERLYTIPGSPPNLLHETQGDAFAARNKYALEVDDKADPPMFKVSDTHYAATWLLDPRAPKVEMPQELKARLERMKKEAKDYGSEL